MKTIYKFLSLFTIVAFFASCNADPEYYSPLGGDLQDDMHVKASESKVTLVKADEAKDAITFTWDKVQSSLSPDGDVTYAIRLFNADNPTEATSFYQVGTATSKTFSVYELNSIIGRWVPAGAICNLSAQVVAKMANNAHYVLPMKSVCSFSAIGYERFPAVLYMHIMDETTKEEKEIKPLTQTSLGSGVYTLELAMNSCYYYFTTADATSEESGASYVANPDRMLDKGVALKLNMAEVTEDDYLQYQGTGKTTIVIDLNDPEEDTPGLDVRFVNILALPTGASGIWITGDACPSILWSAENPEGKFVNLDPRSPWIYSWTGVLEYKAEGNENTFKLLTSSSFENNVFFAPEANTDPAKNTTLLPYRDQGNGGDNKWKIAEDVNGRYTITISLDKDDMWIHFEQAAEEEE